MEAPPRFELGHIGFADLCLTTWPWCQTILFSIEIDVRGQLSSSPNIVSPFGAGVRRKHKCNPRSLWSEVSRMAFAIHATPLERETGFGPATSTLARWHSTTESLPQNDCLSNISNNSRFCNPFFEISAFFCMRYFLRTESCIANSLSSSAFLRDFAISKHFAVSSSSIFFATSLPIRFMMDGSPSSSRRSSAI